jgi:hypothetical protein
MAGLIELAHTLGLVAAYNPDQPRDERGRWSSDGGAVAPSAKWTDTAKPGEIRPEFGHSHANGVAVLAAGKEGYNAAHGMPAPAVKDWQTVTQDPARGAQIAKDYAALPPGVSQDAVASYQALASEVHQQYDYLTHDLGVHVEVVQHDPYQNIDELTHDIRDNNTLKVLGTAETGGHPFFTNEQNDEFRAVHDAFGHAAIGRGFDRNGEEAAYESHRQMFSEKAAAALTTETRGQNSALVYGGRHEFPEQKVAILPARDLVASSLVAAGSLLDPDDDNAYDITHCHHTSLGRALLGRRGGPATKGLVAALVRLYSDDQARDSQGRWTAGEGGVTIEPPAAAGAGTTMLVHDKDGNVTGRVEYTKSEDAQLGKIIDIHGIAVTTQRQGTGTEMLKALHDRNPGYTLMHGSFSSPEGFYQAKSMAEKYPEWNKLWLNVSKEGYDVWKPGTPIPRDSNTFDVMSDEDRAKLKLALVLIALGWEDEARDDRGRWTSDGGGDVEEKIGGKDAISQMVKSLLEPDGGFTIDPRDGSTPDHGFAVAIQGHESITPTGEFFQGGPPYDHAVDVVDQWLQQNADAFKDPAVMVGGWHDPVHGEIALDPSRVVEDRAEAIKLGQQNNQQAIADLAAIHAGDWDNAIIPTGGTGNREQSAALLVAALGGVRGVGDFSDDLFGERAAFGVGHLIDRLGWLDRNDRGTGRLIGHDRSVPCKVDNLVAALVQLYSEDQPRVPAGNGPESGRWGDSGSVDRTAADARARYPAAFLKGAFWHGSPNGQAGLKQAAYGLHVGTYQAAKEALEARIGKRADGKDWDGTQEYGRTLVTSSGAGYGIGPDQKPTVALPTGEAMYSNGERVPMDAKPDLFPVRIVGPMSNTTSTPHEDFKANGYMRAQITRGTARRGYYYTNEGEDAGSISAVVPNADHLQTYDQWRHPDSPRTASAALVAALVALADDEPRVPAGSPDGGQWTKDDGGGGGGSAPSAMMERVGGVIQNAVPDRSITDAALKEAADLPPGTHYENADEWSNYVQQPVGADMVLAPPIEEQTWTPGSKEALSEAVTQWQQTYDGSRGIQVAADALLGYGEQHDNSAVTPQYAADAREILTAMAGQGPDGAASANTLNEEANNGHPVGLQEFGSGELARGVDDHDGSMLAALQNAHDTNSQVEWSINAFVQGGDRGLANAQYMNEEMGAGMYTTHEDPDTGDTVESTGNQIAAQSALLYTTSDQGGNAAGKSGALGEHPVLMLASGKALTLDGNFEALMGGKFAVDTIRPMSPDEEAEYNYKKGAPPVTVVELHQVENVQLPHGVATR